MLDYLTGDNSRLFNLIRTNSFISERGNGGYDDMLKHLTGSFPRIRVGVAYRSDYETIFTVGHLLPPSLLLDEIFVKTTKIFRQPAFGSGYDGLGLRLNRHLRYGSHQDVSPPTSESSSATSHLTATLASTTKLI